MIIREVSAWAHRTLFLGLSLPLLGYAWLAAYNPLQGFWWNARYQQVVIPFLHSQNPINCIFDSIRSLIPAILAEYRPDSTCTYNTTIPFIFILTLSLFFLIISGYLYWSQIEMPNLWPTVMPPKEEETQTETNPEQDLKLKKKVHVRYDGPIPPSDGGF